MWVATRGDCIVKRWPLCILLCLILGAITTVAVAWGFAAWIDLSEPSSLIPERLINADEVARWNHDVPSDITSKPVIATPIRAFGLSAVYVTSDRTGKVQLVTDDSSRVTDVRF